MRDRPLSEISEKELFGGNRRMLQLGRAKPKARAVPLRQELLRRQVETGESNIEHDGWQSVLTKQKVSASLIESEYGYQKG